METLDRLLEILYAERGEAVPELDARGKALAFRALCNVRPPHPASAEFIRLQDEYLSALTRGRGIVRADSLYYNGGIALWQGDITRLASDAIVNACNSALLGCFQPLHECIDNAIHTFAGVQVRLDCDKIMQGGLEAEGQVRVTEAYNLPTKYIFHTVGPQVRGKPTLSQRRTLSSCYASCLAKANEIGLETLAFCCISTGVFGYPKRAAAEVAVRTVRERRGKARVIFCVFDEENYGIYKELLKGD